MSTNIVHHLTDLESVTRWWPFFVEGAAALNGISKQQNIWTPEYLFEAVTKILDMERLGYIALLTSKNQKPLAWGLCHSATDSMSGEPYFFVLGAYSNGKCATATRELCTAAESYARSIGHHTLKAGTFRLTGAAIRLFESSWGFRRESLTFSKTI